MIDQVLFIVLTSFAALAIVIIGLIWLMLRAFMRDIYSFMLPIDDEQPSPAENMITKLGQSAGKSIAMEVKTTALGKASGEARLEKAIEGDIVQDVVGSANPLIGLALDNLPSLKKRALKNPGVIDWLLSNLGSAKSFNRPDNHNEPSDYAARLNKYR